MNTPVEILVNEKPSQVDAGKREAHERWNAQLNREEFRSLLERREFPGIADRAVKIESPTNLIFSFEKMALRDAVRSAAD